VFRPNLIADTADQFGLAIGFRGSRPVSRSVVLGGEVALEGATGDFEFAKGSALARVIVTPGGPVSFAASATAGTSRGAVPIQHRFFLGGPVTLRGYDGGITSGNAFWAGRLEVANSRPAVRLSGFADAGWAGDRASFSTGRPLLSAGVGASFLDGLIRMDLARALRAPTGWRFDLYFDGIL
jgi:hemolysin activation/secretion protein